MFRKRWIGFWFLKIIRQALIFVTSKKNCITNLGDLGGFIKAGFIKYWYLVFLLYWNVFFQTQITLKKNNSPTCPFYYSFQVEVAWTNSAFRWKKTMRRIKSERMYLSNLWYLVDLEISYCINLTKTPYRTPYNTAESQTDSLVIHILWSSNFIQAVWKPLALPMIPLFQVSSILCARLESFYHLN